MTLIDDIYKDYADRFDCFTNRVLRRGAPYADNRADNVTNMGVVWYDYQDRFQRFQDLGACLPLVTDPPPPSGYDDDAQAIITAIETADVVALETVVRDAINTFVVGAKSAGVWSSLGTFRFLAGPRTLAGVFAAGIGTAPTNFGFVAGDFIRATGLAGNRVNKYLDSNVPQSTHPQDSRHLAVWVSTVDGALVAKTYAGVADAGATLISLATTTVFVLTRCATSVSATTLGTLGATGLIGVNRSSGAEYTMRALGVNNTIVQASVTSNTLTTTLFARNTVTVPNQYANARLAFYSLGTDTDLASLDSLLTAYMSSISGI